MSPEKLKEMEKEVLEIFERIKNFESKYGEGHIYIVSGMYENEDGENMMGFEYVPDDTVNSFERVFYYDEKGIRRG